MKRIFALMLTISMMFTAVYVSAESSENVKINENAINLLEKLEIVFPKNSEAYSSEISRADFAVYAARTLGYDDTTDPGDTRYYVDMAMYDYAAYSVNCLVERGILSVGDNKLFRPDEPITYSEAVKMAVCMLGYKPVAEVKGGYPGGFMLTAKQLDILDGISADAVNKFSLNDAITLLYNTISAPLYEMESLSVSGDDAAMSFRISPDNTLLYENFDYKLIEGILTGFDGMNIAFDVMSAENRAVVGGVSYLVEENLDLEELLGSNVCVLVDKDDKIIFAYHQAKNDRAVTIDIRDFVSYDGDKLIYGQDNKDKKIDVSAAYVLYNGSVPASNVRDLFLNLESGTIKVVDYNGDGINDAIIVNDYHAYVLKAIDTVKNVIYCKNGNPGVIELELYEKYEIINKAGNEAALADIEEDSVLNVLEAPDKSRIVIVVSEDFASGIVEKIWNQTTFEFQADGKVYRVNKNHSDIYNEIIIGQKATYLLNIFGEVVMVSEVVRENYNIGYLYRMGIDGTLDKQLKLRMFTKNNGLQTLTVSDNVRIDGITYKDAVAAARAIPETLCDEEKVNSFETQMILFKTNGAGEISEIDTYNSTGEDKNLTLARLTDGKSKLMKYEGRIDKAYPINANTDFYCVPLGNSSVENETEFKVVKQTAFNRAVSFEFECYKIKGKNEFVDIVLYRMDPSNTRENSFLNSNMFLVGEKIRAIDKNQNVYTMLTGLMQGNEHSVEIYEDALVATSVNTANIDEGDLICYRKDETGKVIEIEMLYDFVSGSGGTKNTGAYLDPFNTANFGGNFYLSCGYVKEKGNNVVGWCYNVPASKETAVDEALDLSTVKCMYYDGSSREGTRLYTGSMDMMSDYDTVNGSCDIIIVQFVQTMLKSVVVYKNN